MALSRICKWPVHSDSTPEPEPSDAINGPVGSSGPRILGATVVRGARRARGSAGSSGPRILEAPSTTPTPDHRRLPATRPKRTGARGNEPQQRGRPPRFIAWAQRSDAEPGAHGQQGTRVFSVYAGGRHDVPKPARDRQWARQCAVTTWIVRMRRLHATQARMGSSRQRWATTEKREQRETIRARRRPLSAKPIQEASRRRSFLVKATVLVVLARQTRASPNKAGSRASAFTTLPNGARLSAFWCTVGMHRVIPRWETCSRERHVQEIRPTTAGRTTVHTHAARQGEHHRNAAQEDRGAEAGHPGGSDDVPSPHDGAESVESASGLGEAAAPRGRSCRIRKHEPTGGKTAPVLDAALQRPELAGEGTSPGASVPQTVEELLRRPMRFRLQPLDDTGPRLLEQVLPSAPVSRRSLVGLVRRPHLAGAPSERQAPQKAVEVGIALRHRMNRRARSQSGQMTLNRTDLRTATRAEPGSRPAPADGLSSRREPRPRRATAHTASPARGSACGRERRPVPSRRA